MTTAELIQRLTKAMFSEVEAPRKATTRNRKPAISSMRRNLQRSYLEELSKLALGRHEPPRTIARRWPMPELSDAAADKSLLDNRRWPASWTPTAGPTCRNRARRIEKVLDARLTVASP